MLKFKNDKEQVVLEMNDQGCITKQTLPLKEKITDNTGETLNDIKEDEKSI